MEPILKSGRKVIGFDIVNRFENTPDFEFRNESWLEFKPDTLLDYDIVFNPPYKYAKEFVEHSLNIVEEGRKVCAFLKVQFLEGKARKKLFKEHPPKNVFISSSRILCAKNGDFQSMKESGGSAVAYAWYVWEKGYNGQTVVDWFN